MPPTCRQRSSERCSGADGGAPASAGKPHRQQLRPAGFRIANAHRPSLGWAYRRASSLLRRSPIAGRFFLINIPIIGFPLIIMAISPICHIAGLPHRRFLYRRARPIAGFPYRRLKKSGGEIRRYQATSLGCRGRGDSGRRCLCARQVARPTISPEDKTEERPVPATGRQQGGLHGG